MPELPLPEPVLTDGVVTLRARGMDDVAATAVACVDPDIQRFTMVPDNYTEELAAAYIVESEERRLAGTGLVLAICDFEDRRRLLGQIGLVQFEPSDDRAEIGYWVAPQARGRGVAARAIGLLSRWTLRELDVVRIDLLAHVENVASQRAAARAGFTREGLLRAYSKGKHGQEDVVMFSLLAADVAP